MAPYFEKTDQINVPVEEVYAVVADVEKYAEFLPGVDEAKQVDDKVTMTVNVGPAKVSWTSKAVYVTDESITFTLIEGPFKQLDGRWEFEPNGSNTRIKCTTHFELSLPIHGANRIAARGIEANSNAIIKAFKERLEAR